MAICAYYCEDCKIEFQIWYKSLKDCLPEAEHACGALCQEVIGTSWKQNYGYKATEE